MTPLFRFSGTRNAYVLRGVGNRVGPVLHVERRRNHTLTYGGAERRAARTAR